MESNQFQTQGLGERGSFLDTFSIFGPGMIGNDAAGLADGFHGAVVLAHAAEHAGDQNQPGGLGAFGELSPNGGLVANRVEPDLESAQTDLLHLFEKLLGVLRLERPATNGKVITNRNFHNSRRTAFWEPGLRIRS